MEPEVPIHYGHLCTIRVTKFDIVDVFNGQKAASVVFQVQSNKTRAYRTYSVRIPYDTDSPDHKTPIDTVRKAWKDLTGHDISPSSTSVALPNAGQSLVMDEVKEFVRSETLKMGVNLTLDVV